jgi:hypothetical protein
MLRAKCRADCAPMFILSMSLISKAFAPNSIVGRDNRLKEVETITEAVDGVARCAVVVAAWTGLSLAELRGLQWEDIDAALRAADGGDLTPSEIGSKLLFSEPDCGRRWIHV